MVKNCLALSAVTFWKINLIQHTTLNMAEPATSSTNEQPSQGKQLSMFFVTGPNPLDLSSEQLAYHFAQSHSEWIKDLKMQVIFKAETGKNDGRVDAGYKHVHAAMVVTAKTSENRAKRVRESTVSSKFVQAFEGSSYDTKELMNYYASWAYLWKEPWNNVTYEADEFKDIAAKIPTGDELLDIIDREIDEGYISTLEDLPYFVHVEQRNVHYGVAQGTEQIRAAIADNCGIMFKDPGRDANGHFGAGNNVARLNGLKTKERKQALFKRMHEQNMLHGPKRAKYEGAKLMIDSMKEGYNIKSAFEDGTAILQMWTESTIDLREGLQWMNGTGNRIRINNLKDFTEHGPRKWPVVPEINKLIKSVYDNQDTSQACPFIQVVGPSGSGKSMLVEDWLSEQQIAPSERWQMATGSKFGIGLETGQKVVGTIDDLDPSKMSMYFKNFLTAIQSMPREECYLYCAIPVRVTAGCYWYTNLAPFECMHYTWKQENEKQKVGTDGIQICRRTTATVVIWKNCDCGQENCSCQRAIKVCKPCTMNAATKKIMWPAAKGHVPDDILRNMGFDPYSDEVEYVGPNGDAFASGFNAGQ